MRTLFKDAKIGGLSIKNRLIRSATYEGMADENGGVTSQLYGVYTRLAEGNLGLIITSGAYILPEGKGMPGMLGIHDDSLIEGYRRLTHKVHQTNSKIVMQLLYCGTQGYINIPHVFSPSAIPEKVTKRTGKIMSLTDIVQLKKAYVEAAVRAKTAGFDGVQIHAATGFLLSQFLCPYYNHRTDFYGGYIKNRMRLLMEVYEEIRQVVGWDFAVLVKINCADFIEEGLTFEDSLYVCQCLEEKGIDALEITGGMVAVREKVTIRPNIIAPEQEAYFAQYASKIADKVKTPIILVGGLRSPEVMQRLLNQTRISYFSMCRPLISEPNLVKRWQGGEQERARCLSCNKCSSFSGTYCKLYGEACIEGSLV
jgi:2,4-dienoyl-CoA reductase-like NADH-dependent reductase (Old Yellow Enzyme family)